MKGIKISLAGDLGSGKSTVGKLLAEEFGAELYSTGTIQRAIATEMGMTTLQLNQYMETHPEIDNKIDDGLRALESEEKNLIIDSRMAWHFVPSSFSVYMMAEPYISAERIMKAGRSSEPFASVEEAVCSITERRKSEMLRYTQLYSVNIKDMENYRYVIDTSYVFPETVAAHIAAHYRMFMAGERFSRYELCPERLLPCGREEGEPSVYEQGGAWYIASGQSQIAEQIRSGARLIACSRGQVDPSLCTADKISAWQARTGVKIKAMPFGK